MRLKWFLNVDIFTTSKQCTYSESTIVHGGNFLSCAPMRTHRGSDAGSPVLTPKLGSYDASNLSDASSDVSRPPLSPVQSPRHRMTKQLGNQGATAVCVECMAENEHLYRQYSEGNLRLTRCCACQSFVDKYVEYDAVLLVLDLILHKNPVYRHILFNDARFTLRDNDGRLQKHVLRKLVWYTLMIILLDTWTKFIAVETSYGAPSKLETVGAVRWTGIGLYGGDVKSASGKRWDLVEFLQDWPSVQQLFLYFVLAGLENLIYFMVLALASGIAYQGGLVNRKEALDKYFIGKAFIISSFCRPMLLLFLIWDYKPDFIHLLNFFAMTSNVAVLSAMFDDAIATPCIIAGLAFSCRNLGQVVLHIAFGLPSMFSTTYSPW